MAMASRVAAAAPPRWPARLSGLANPLDLRSDTLTRPSARMRARMSLAKVGDDVFGEDPSVLELEELGARMGGKQACAFVASGTMGNLCSILAHADRRGSELVCGDRCHVYLHEQGGAATLGGVHTRTVATLRDGTLAVDDVLRAIRPGTGSDRDDGHYPRTALVCVENTHNDCGGVALPVEYVEALCRAVRGVGKPIKVHMDGARVGNAAVKLGRSLRDVCAPVDSVSMCLSKGLGAPVGSLVMGDEDFVWRVKRIRKALGGGWRQAGMLAAAGIVALEEMETTLKRDHDLAKEFASRLAQLPGVTVVVPLDQLTNMVFFRVEGGLAAAKKLVEHVAQEEGMLMGVGYGSTGDVIRAAIHRDVNEDELLGTGVRAVREAVAMGN